MKILIFNNAVWFPTIKTSESINIIWTHAVKTLPENIESRYKNNYKAPLAKSKLKNLPEIHHVNY